MSHSIFKNKRILITAGPTREAIDPVRHISNHSSGKMGYAIAAQLLAQGSEVIIISGPVCVTLEHPRLTIVNVQSANEMFLACCGFFEQLDIAIFAAAVADYRPAKVATQKIKKDDSAFTIHMVKNVDIAYEFGKIKTNNQLSVGFALETDDELNHAIGKLQRKKFDMVILNSMNDANATFGFDTNKISILKGDYSRTDYPLKDKKVVAEDILHELGILYSLRELRRINEESLEYETMYQ